MKKEDIKIGYVVEIKHEGESSLTMVLPSRTDDLAISGGIHWFPLNRFGDDLVYEGRVITKVYGLSRNRYAHELSTRDRDLLWVRDDSKEYTIKELEAILGHKIKIV